jgi:predicted metal-dependent phosphotriesterase family hydrolase
VHSSSAKVVGRDGRLRRPAARHRRYRGVVTGDRSSTTTADAVAADPTADLVVMTVRGPIAPSALGVTLSHDHVLLDGWSIFRSYSAIMDDQELAADELRRYRAAGGTSLCDPTNIGLGRDPVALRRISEASGVNIVMGAGWYREITYPADLDRRSTDDLADQLVRELDVGVDGTAIRAGFIGEIGTERGSISPLEERVFRAAARAHRRTGCPVMTHTTHFGELALEQLALLAEAGVRADRVIVSHMGDRREQRPLLAVAATGAWLSIDNLGFVVNYAPLDVRADNVARLWAEGYGSRVLLGNDTCETGQLVANGGPGYANVLERVRPLLAARGITDEQFHAMTVENPARAYAYAARPAATGPSAAADD